MRSRSPSTSSSSGRGETMLVIGISGSLRAGSYNTRLLRAAARGLPPEAEFRELQGLDRIPPYSEDLDLGLGPEPVRELRASLHRADAILISTPEYNHSIPGQLKNALDWASRPFRENSLQGQPVAVVGASTGMFGAVWAQAEVRKVLAAIGAQVLDAELPVASAADAFDADGELRDPELRARLAEITGELVRVAAVCPSCRRRSDDDARGFRTPLKDPARLERGRKLLGNAGGPAGARSFALGRPSGLRRWTHTMEQR
jgi:chromate reductase, NAD(P)H dehydrogenase (quinone)